MAKALKLVIAAAALLAFSASARAADMPSLWPQDEEEQSPQAREYRSGWYLRGDLGYRFNRIGHTDAGTPVVGSSIDKGVSAGGGFGFKHRWFRGDLTIDYGAPVKFKASTQSVASQPQYTTSIDSTAVLANAYLDLGTWAGLTPYAGVGIGASYLRTYNYRNSASPAAEVVPIGTKWNMAWAAMAGVSFRVKPRWEIDVGYRYLNLGTAYGGLEATGNQTAIRNLTAQEVRVGFRYLLD